MSLRVRAALVVAVITMVVLGALLSFNRFVLPSDSEVGVAVASTPDGARVTVTDQCPSIPSDDLERVFEKFYRANNAARSAQGTGLSLPIARTIAELHGGRLWLQSDGKQGATSILFIPAQAVEAGA